MSVLCLIMQPAARFLSVFYQEKRRLFIATPLVGVEASRRETATRGDFRKRGDRPLDREQAFRPICR